MPNAPLRHVAGSTVTTVVDPRFGTGAAPTQPSGWGGGGGTSVGTNGDIRGMGFHVPPGSLANLTAALANNATDQRVEIPYFGDSTGFGSGQLLGGPPRKLRALILAAGVTDGGRGIARISSGGGSESWGGDYVTAIQSRTGFDEESNGYHYPPLSAAKSTVVGSTITLQGYGTAIRLIGFGLQNATYRVDGGAEQTPPTPSFGNGLSYVYVSGLTYGLHTITVTHALAGEVAVNAEFLRDTGVVIHQDSRSGGTTSSYFDAVYAKGGVGVANNTGAQYGLGLTSTKGTTTTDWFATPAPRPAARNVKAAIFSLGINDMSWVDTGDPNGSGAAFASKVSENFAHFVRMTRSAEADPILAVPHLEEGGPNKHLVAGRFQAALVSTAESMSVAWCDYHVAMRQAGFGRGTGIHPAQVVYDAQAQFLFDNVVSHALPE